MKIKTFDTCGYRLIHYGKPFPIDLRNSDDSDLTTLLDKGERFVYWFQLKSSSSIHDQIPALRFGTQYFAVNLKMMKLLWRHVRLNRQFSNRERCVTGGYKLCIPLPLYLEKRRTQARSKVRHSWFLCNFFCSVF